MSQPESNTLAPWRKRLHEIIFEADTPAGKTFDVVLLFLIGLSVIVVMLESVGSIQSRYHDILVVLEWVLTILFTIEYIFRIISLKRPTGYIFSFFGIVDLISILPTYLSLFVFGTQALTVVRAIRLLRIFRIFKLGHYLDESAIITTSLKASQRKISVFLFAIMMIVLVIGAIMYLIEGESNPGFSSIPLSVYWAIVTLTTVGFGDITPQTPLGQFMSAVVMIIGYAVIAVPTGIVSAEMVQQERKRYQLRNTQVCQFCAEDHHDPDALYCKSCGHKL